MGKKTKSTTTWKTDAHIKIAKQPKIRHANTVADCGLKDRSSSKKKKSSKLGGDLKSKRKMKKQESRRYDQGKIFRVPGLSALDVLMAEAEANTAARKNGIDPVLSPVLSPDADDGSGSENGRDEKLTTQPRMQHAKSAMMGSNSTKTKKKKAKKVSKTAKRQSAAVTSSSRKKSSKSAKKTKSKKKNSIPPSQPKFKHANTISMGSKKSKKKTKNGKKSSTPKGRGRAASSTWKSGDHQKSKSTTLKDPRKHMKKIVSRRYDESIGLKAKGMSGLNVLWAEIDAKKAAKQWDIREDAEEEPHLEHANTIGANLRNMKFDMNEFEDNDDETKAKDEFVDVGGDDEDDYTTDDDFDDEEMPTPMSQIDAAMNEQLLNLCYTEDEIVKAFAVVSNKNEINDVVAQIELMRQQTADSRATSLSPVFRRPKDDTSPSPSSIASR